MQLPLALWIEDEPQETVKRLSSWHCKTFLLGSTTARDGINKTPGGVSSPNMAGIATMCFLQMFQMIKVHKCHIYYKHFRWARSIYYDFKIQFSAWKSNFCIATNFCRRIVDRTDSDIALSEIILTHHFFINWTPPGVFDPSNWLRSILVSVKFSSKERKKKRLKEGGRLSRLQGGWRRGRF